MTRIVRRREAVRDLAVICSYIASENETAANALLERIDAVLNLLADHPHIGTLKRRGKSNLRSFTVGRYILFYQPISGGIRLVRVLHGARDLRTVTFD